MEDGNKSQIIRLWCLQTLSTSRRRAHSNSIQNVKHTEFTATPFSTLYSFQFCNILTLLTGELIFLTFVFGLKMNIVFAR